MFFLSQPYLDSLLVYNHQPCPLSLFYSHLSPTSLPPLFLSSPLLPLSINLAIKLSHNSLSLVPPCSLFQVHCHYCATASLKRGRSSAIQSVSRMRDRNTWRWLLSLLLFRSDAHFDSSGRMSPCESVGVEIPSGSQSITVFHLMRRVTIDSPNSKDQALRKAFP
jgi:hypothetical protein